MENGGAREDRTPDLLRARQALSQLSYGPGKLFSRDKEANGVVCDKQMNRSPTPYLGKLVGLGGLEPPTSPLSGVRSNHLSYRPNNRLGSCRPVSASLVQVTCVGAPSRLSTASLKGGDPAAGSPTATLLRLHPSHRPHRGRRPPEG